MSAMKAALEDSGFMFDDAQLPCSRCGEMVNLDFDLNEDVRWFNLRGTSFCGPRGQLFHVVDSTTRRP